MTSQQRSTNDIATLAYGASPQGNWENLDAVWVAVRPYLRVRANDIHLPQRHRGTAFPALFRDDLLLDDDMAFVAMMIALPTIRLGISHGSCKK